MSIIAIAICVVTGFALGIVLPALALWLVCQEATQHACDMVKIVKRYQCVLDNQRIRYPFKFVFCFLKSGPVQTPRGLPGEGRAYVGVVRDVPALLEKLEGSALRLPALLGLLCGMRLGEVLALRWGRVDLNRKIVEVREALEQTKVHGIRFKSAKTKAGRRDITMPDSVVEALKNLPA